MARKGPQSPLIVGEGVTLRHAWSLPRPGPLDLSPDGARLFYLDGQAGSLLCRDTRSGDVLWRQPAYADHLSVSPDGARVALSTGQGRLSMFDADTGQLLGDHQAGDGPRGKLCWSPDGGRVLAVHAHARPLLALLEHDGRHLSLVTAPGDVRSASFVRDDRLVVELASTPCVIELHTGSVVEEFANPGFVIGVAANRHWIALTRDHGHLLLRANNPGAPLPSAAALKRQNEPIYRERMARNALRLEKVRDKGSLHTLTWEKQGAERLWRDGVRADGWSLWLPLPHNQTHHMRFVRDDGPLLLLCDGRDVSLLSLGEVVTERLLLGLFPIVGAKGYLCGASYRAGVAAIGVDSDNPRLPAQIVVADVSSAP